LRRDAANTTTMQLLCQMPRSQARQPSTQQRMATGLWMPTDRFLGALQGAQSEQRPPHQPQQEQQRTQPYTGRL
jgi:hypothetical protein